MIGGNNQQEHTRAIVKRETARDDWGLQHGFGQTHMTVMVKITAFLAIGHGHLHD